MPPTPKSSTKKEKFLWYNCAKCNITICHTNLESHELDCEKKADFISGENYYPSLIQNSLPTEIEEKDVQKLYLQRFVFIPESICNFCKMTQGCNVLVGIGNQKIVKKLWTINDKHLNSVYCNSEDMKIDNMCEKNVVISKLLTGNSVKICSKIELLMLEKLDDTRDIERLLKAQLKNTIVHQSNTIVLEFINKRIKFQIKSITKSSEDDIVTQFSQIQLSDNIFYLIDSVTSIVIAGNFKSDSQQVEKKPKYSLDQVGGLDSTVQDLKKTLDLALGTVTNDCTMKISRGVLIYGLSGSGKTLLCHALANSYNVHKIQIDSWKIFSKYYGESEANLKKCFQEGFDKYPNPTIIIIDELFNICPKNDNSDAVKRVSTLLVSLLDSLHTKRDGSKIFVLANTSNIDNVDPTIRRSGRLDFEVEIPVPNATIREQILIKLLAKHKINVEEIKQVAKHTHGYVGADLENLLAKSISLENRNGSFSASLQFQDIIQNLNQIKPSAMRELLIEKPDVKWSDIGGQTDLKLKLKQIVEWPINHPETFERLGIKPPRGLLMFGPPGCSKTMIAKALATESNLNFISIKGSDLFSMWVGESEKAVRELFVKARQLSPCIVFFDEIDAIGGERSSDSGSSVKERVLAQILTEIDGVHTLKNVIIIAATNRPDLIDKALMRPGRLDRIVYVQLPDAETRREIFKIKLSKIPIGKDVDIESLVSKTNGHSGAEIEAICKEAALKALEHSFDIEEIGMVYFDQAIELVRPRTSKELLELYDMYLKIVYPQYVYKDRIIITRIKMVIYGVYIVSKSGGLIFNHDHSMPRIETEKTFSFPLDINLEFTKKKISVVFGQRDGIFVGHVLIAINGITVNGDTLEDGKNVKEFLETKENFPLNLRFCRPKMTTNEKIFLASMFYPLFAIASQMSPEPKSSGIEILEADTFKLHCFQTLTGVKFMVVAEPAAVGLDILLKKIYEIYSDYVLKNPFYSLEMPIRCELFDVNLQTLLDQVEKTGISNI